MDSLNPDPSGLTCAQARELIGDLTAVHIDVPLENRAFHDHVAACAECRALHAETVADNRLLSTWVAPAPRGNTQARVMAAIAQAERERREKESGRGFWGLIAAALFGTRIRVPAAAMAVLALLLLVSLGMNAKHLIGDRSSAPFLNPQPPQSVAMNDNKIIPVIKPGLTPDGADSTEKALAAAVRAYGQYPVNMPVPIIVIMGAPPVETTRLAKLSDI